MIKHLKHTILFIILFVFAANNFTLAQETKKHIITGQDSAAITLDYPIDDNTTIIINGDGTITIGGTTTEIVDDLASGTTPADATERNNFFDDITEVLSNKIQELNGTDNLARYKQGKLVGQIAAQILIAAATAGNGNIEEGMSFILSNIKSLPKKFITFVRAGYSEIANLSVTGNIITYGEKSLIKLRKAEQAEELLILAPLPETAAPENVSILKNKFFENTEFTLPDGKKLKLLIICILHRHRLKSAAVFPVPFSAVICVPWIF